MKNKLFLIFSFILLFTCKTIDENTQHQAGTTVENGTDPANEKKVDERLTFELTDQTDKQTLRQHMKNLFVSIEEKIAHGDYEEWYAAISSKYQRFISDQDYLYRISKKSAYLTDKNIILKNAEDFFKLVVIEARLGKSLIFTGYKYINKNHVKVISVLDGSQEFVYNFINEDGIWKLDL